MHSLCRPVCPPHRWCRRQLLVKMGRRLLLRQRGRYRCVEPQVLPQGTGVSPRAPTLARGVRQRRGLLSLLALSSHVTVSAGWYSAHAGCGRIGHVGSMEVRAGRHASLLIGVGVWDPTSGMRSRLLSPAPLGAVASPRCGLCFGRSAPSDMVVALVSDMVVVLVRAVLLRCFAAFVCFPSLPPWRRATPLRGCAYV